MCDLIQDHVQCKIKVLLRLRKTKFLSTNLRSNRNSSEVSKIVYALYVLIHIILEIILVVFIVRFISVVRFSKYCLL